MKNSFKFALIGLMIALSACSTTAPTQTTVIDTPHLNPNLPTQVELQPVQFKVYTSTDLKQLSTKNNVVLFTLTKQQYENLGKNLTAIDGYIKELKQTVIFYRQQNDSTNEPTTNKK